MADLLEGSSPKTEAPYLPLDDDWEAQLHRSGWQGWIIFAGQEDVLDQSILFWMEGKSTQRSTNLSLRVRVQADARVREKLAACSGVTIHHGKIPYPRKQIVAGEVHPLDSEWTLNGGTAMDASLETNLRVRYLPYEIGGDTTPFSAQGSLSMVLEPSSGTHDEARYMLDALSSRLGVDTTLSSAADLELLYLRKMAFSMRVDCTRPAHPSDMRDWISEQFGSDVTQIPSYDWRPRFCTAYNPWTAALGSGAAGWPHWMRFDLDLQRDGDLAQHYLGYNLGENAAGVGDRLARLIRSTGHLLAPDERWMRLGTPSISALHDWGGGAYVPLRLQNNTGANTLVFDPRLLLRQDAIAVGTDGDSRLSPQALTDRLPLADYTRVSQCHVYLKRGVSLLDALVAVNLERPQDRSKVLEAFRAVGILEVRGVPIDTVVRVR